MPIFRNQDATYTEPLHIHDFNKNYIKQLEKKLEDIHDMCYNHEELPDGYYDTEAVVRDETLNEIIKLIEK